MLNLSGVPDIVISIRYILSCHYGNKITKATSRNWLYRKVKFFHNSVICEYTVEPRYLEHPRKIKICLS